MLKMQQTFNTHLMCIKNHPLDFTHNSSISNAVILDAEICNDDAAAAAATLLSTALPASVLTFGRFNVADDVFVNEGTPAEDDDDCTERPLTFNACSLDIYHTYKHTRTWTFDHILTVNKL